MKKLSLSLLLLATVLPVNAQTISDDYSYIEDVVRQLKTIVLKQKASTEAEQTLSKIKNAQPLIKDGHYQGHQIIQGNEIIGFIGVSYQENKASIAVFSTPPLRVRYATRAYKAYRSILQQHYEESSHNLYELGEGIVARLKKKARKVSVDVYRK